VREQPPSGLGRNERVIPERDRTNGREEKEKRNKKRKKESDKKRERKT
jgi:hypothetical protein